MRCVNIFSFITDNVFNRHTSHYQKLVYHLYLVHCPTSPHLLSLSPHLLSLFPTSYSLSSPPPPLSLSLYPPPPPSLLLFPSGNGASDLEWQALSYLLRYPPELLVGALGEERYRGGVVSLFQCLQCHTLNKQVRPFPAMSHTCLYLSPSSMPLSLPILHSSSILYWMSLYWNWFQNWTLNCPHDHNQMKFLVSRHSKHITEDVIQFSINGYHYYHMDEK